MALSQQTIDTVKATVPVLRVHGSEIITNFYDTLFSRYPDVKKYFNMDRHKGGKTATGEIPAQVSALTNAVLAYAKHIDQIEKIMPVVKKICYKHVSRGVVAIQYDAVGESLLFAIKHVLGEAATDPIMAAWEEAYKFLAKAFVNMENEIRAGLEERAGYAGMVDMKVTNILEVDNGGKQMSLLPVDYPTPPHSPNMFVSIATFTRDGTQSMTTMNIIGNNEKHMRIEVPYSEEGASKFLLEDVQVGSVIKVSVPCGDIGVLE